MVNVLIATQAEMSPQLLKVVRTTNELSAAERLFLAKLLLDSLVTDQPQPLFTPIIDLAEQLPTLEEVVAQIKATPPNPWQIQRATKTIEEILADWEDNPTHEPRLSAAEWEQSWWAVRQEMKQRDQNRVDVTKWITYEDDGLPAGHQSPLHNGH